MNHEKLDITKVNPVPSNILSKNPPLSVVSFLYLARLPSILSKTCPNCSSSTPETTRLLLSDKISTEGMILKKKDNQVRPI